MKCPHCKESYHPLDILAHHFALYAVWTERDESRLYWWLHRAMQIVRRQRPHVCLDREPWTQAERDEWRASARRRSPAIKFVPSTQWHQDHFGARNRADALEARG